MKIKEASIFLLLISLSAATNIFSDMDDFAIRIKNDKDPNSPFEGNVSVSGPNLASENRKLRSQLQAVKSKLLDLKEMTRKVQQLKDENAELQSRMTKTRGDINSCVQENQSISRKLDESRRNADHCFDDLNILKSDNDQCRSKVQGLQRILDDLNNTKPSGSTSQTPEVKVLSAKVGSLEVELTNQKLIFSACQTENQKLHTKLDSIISESSGLRKESQDIASKLNACQDEGVKLVSSVNDSKGHITSLTTDNQALKEENGGLISKLNGYEDALQKLNTCQISLTKCDESKKESGVKILALEADIAKKIEESKFWGEDIKGAKAKAAELERQIEVLRTSNKKLFDDWQAQLTLNQKCQDGSRNSAETLAKREQEITDLNAKIKDFNQQVLNAQKNIKDLEDSLKTKDGLIASFNVKETKCQKLETEVETFQITIQNLRVEISQKNTRIEEQKTSNAACQSDAEKLLMKVAGISAENQVCAQKATVCQNDTEKFKNDLEKLTKTFDTLSVENKSLKEQVAKPDIKNQQLEQRIAELERLLSDSKYGVAELEKCRSSVQSYLKDVESAGNKNISLEKQLAVQKSTAEQCQVNFDTLNKKYADFEGKFKTLSEEARTVKTEYDSFKLKYDALGNEFASLKDQFNSVSAQLADCNSKRSKLQSEYTSLNLRVLDLSTTIEKLKADQLDCQDSRPKFAELKQQIDVCQFNLEQLKGEKTANFAFIKTLSDEIASLKGINGQLNNDRAEWTKEKATLIEKSENCEQKSTGMLKEISAFKLQIASLTNNLNEIQFSLQLMSTKQIQCSQNAKDLEVQVANLKNGLDKCSSDVSNRNKTISELERTIEILKKELQGKGDVQQVNERFAKELDSLKLNLLALKGDLEAENKERSKNMNQLGQLIQKLTSSPNTYQNLIEKLNSSTKQIEIINQLIIFVDGTVSGLITEKRTLEQANTNCQAKLGDLTSQLQASGQQRAVLDTEKQALGVKLNDCQNEKSSLASQNQKTGNDLFLCGEQINLLRKSQTDSQGQLQKCSSDFNALQVNIANINGNYNNCIAENRNNVSRINELVKIKEGLESDVRNCADRSNQLTSQINDLNNRLGQCGDSVSKLKGEVSGLQANFENARQRNNECATNSDKLNNQLLVLINENKQLQSQSLTLKSNADANSKAYAECTVQRDQAAKSANDLRSAVDSVSAKFNVLQQEFDSYKRSCAATRDENTSLKSKIADLQVNVDNLKISTAQGEVFRIDLNSCKLQTSDLSKEISRLRDSNTQLSDNISKLSTNLSDLKTSWNIISGDKEKCLSENNNLKQRIEGLNAEVQSLSAKNIDLGKQRDLLDGQNQKCREQLAVLNVQVNSIGNELTEKSKLGPLLQECNSSLASWKDQANSLRAKISDYEITNQNLSKNLNSKDSQLETFRAEIARLNNEIGNLTKLFSNEKAQSEDCARKLSDYIKSIEKLSMEGERLNAAVNNLKNDNIRLSDAWTKAQAAVTAGNQCQNELFACRKDLDACASNTRQHESARKVLEAEVIGKSEQIKLLRENMDAIKVELEKLKIEQKSFFITTSVTKRDLMNQITSLEAERAKLLAQISTFTEENGNLRVQITKLTTQLSICDDKDKKLIETTNAYNDLVNRHNQLKIDFNDLQTLLKQRAQQISQLDIKLAQLTDSANQLQNDKERISRDLLAAQGEIGALKIQRDLLKTSNADYTDQITSLSNRLKNLEVQLRDCGTQKDSLSQRVFILEDSDRSCQTLKKEFKDLQTTADLLKSTLADCGKSRSQLDINLGECRTNFNEVNVKFGIFQNESTKTIATLRGDIDRLQIDVKNVNIAIGESKDREDRYKANLNQCSSSNNSFSEELKRFISRLDECKANEEKLNACKFELQSERFAVQNKDKQLTEFRAQLDENRSGWSNCQGQLKEIQTLNKKLDGENSQLNVRVENLKQDLFACSNARKEDLTSWNSQVQDLKSKLEDSDKKQMACRNDALIIQKNYQSLSNDFEACKEGNRLNLEKISRLEKLAGNLERVQAELEKNLQLISSLQKDNTDLSQFKGLYNEAMVQISNMNASFGAQIQACNRERSNLQANFNTIADKVLSLENQLKLANEKVILLSTNNQALNEEKRSLMYKLSQCEFSLKEQETRSGSYASCSTDLSKLREQLKFVQTSKDVLEREKAQLESKLQFTTSQLSQLTTKFRYLITRLEFNNVIQREKVTNPQSYIDNSKDIDISNRVFVGQGYKSDMP